MGTFFDHAERTLPAVLRKRAKLTPDHIYLEFQDWKITFGELDKLTDRAAQGLQTLGVVKGDHVCIMLPNCIEFVIAWFALSKLGAVEVPVNAALRGEGLAYLVNNSDAKTMITDSSLRTHADAALGENSKIERYVIVGKAASLAPNDVLFEKLTTTGNGVVNVAVTTTDRHSVMYTSGTTGAPKGAIVSHHYFFHYSHGLAEAIGIRENDRILMVLPLYHTNPQLFAYGALIHGATMLLRQGFSASTFWADVRESRATVIDCLGVMPMLLTKQPEQSGESENPVRVAYVVPCPPDVHATLTKRFNMRIVQSYGSTEANCSVHFTADCDPAKLGSAGKRWGPIDFRIVDDNDFELPNGKVGEIVVRSDEPWTMFSGYYNKPDETIQAFRNLWFHTGDRGYVDEDGYLWYVDRKKEAIRKSGEMLSPSDVEKVLNSHPDVAECAVVGVPSELGDDEVKAVIVVRAGSSIEPSTLIKFCEGKIAYFMIPRFIEFRERLPKTPSERIEKYKLKENDPSAKLWDRVAAGYKLSRN